MFLFNKIKLSRVNFIFLQTKFSLDFNMLTISDVYTLQQSQLQVSLLSLLLNE